MRFLFAELDESFCICASEWPNGLLKYAARSACGRGVWYLKKQKNNSARRIGTWLSPALLLTAFAILLLAGQASSQPVPSPSRESAALRFSVPGLRAVQSIPPDQYDGTLLVETVCAYTGAYMEDGSDEAVSDVLALIVTNTGDDWLEYAELMMDTDGEHAFFKLSGLPAGSSVLVLEANRKTYDETVTYCAPVCVREARLTDAVLDFSAAFALYTEDGVINLENRSGHDFENEVAVYYKTFENGLYLGGITYCARLEHGLAAGEIAQSLQRHYEKARSVILYMTYDE